MNTIEYNLHTGVRAPLGKVFISDSKHKHVCKQMLLIFSLALCDLRTELWKTSLNCTLVFVYNLLQLCCGTWIGLSDYGQFLIYIYHVGISDLTDLRIWVLHVAIFLDFPNQQSEVKQ